MTAIAVVAAQCSGQHALTSPSSVGAPKGAPIIRSITLDRQNVVAGQAVTASAEVDDPDATGGLRYEWSVAPASGTLDGNGATGQWRSPSNDRVPGSYTLTLTVIKPYIGTDASGHPANLEYRVNGSSAPITVNDAKREMEANSEAFIADVMNPNVTPDLCVRNFADSCDGKQKALRDIATSRAGYSGATGS